MVWSSYINRGELDDKLRIEVVNNFFMWWFNPLIENYFPIVRDDTPFDTDFISPFANILDIYIFPHSPLRLHLFVGRRTAQLQITSTELFKEHFDFVLGGSIRFLTC